jgi:hypothetical protein
MSSSGKVDQKPAADFMFWVAVKALPVGLIRKGWSGTISCTGVIIPGAILQRPEIDDDDDIVF